MAIFNSYVKLPEGKFPTSLIFVATQLTYHWPIILFAIFRVMMCHLAKAMGSAPI